MVSMSRKDTFLTLLVLGTVFVACALIIRSGLVSIASAVRDKPLPALPESVNVREMTIRQATVQAPSGTNTSHNVSVTIENMRVDAEVPKPNAK